ncbi:MAG: hypothetical protein QG673_710 [Pseudomonadota bacterium]|nr:hypothetical protein [Pseudomonadota bacterium]
MASYLRRLRCCFLLDFAMLSMVVMAGIDGCTKHRKPLTCDNSAVTDYLLAVRSESSLVYCSKSLTDIKILQQQQKSLLCGGSLLIKSNLDNRRILSIPVTYTVYRVNQNIDANVSQFEFAYPDKIKVERWTAELNNLSKQLGDYQLSPNGAIYVLKESEQQTLYFNGQPIVPEISNTRVQIEKSYVIESNAVFLIGTYTGGSIDSDTRNNLLIQLVGNGGYKVTRPFAYQSIIQNNNESLVIKGVTPGRPYAESDDFPIYIYRKSSLEILRDIKPDSYYISKFANLTPQDIIIQSKHEQCFDTDNNMLSLSHTCSYGSKYCFEFGAIKESKKPDHDLDHDRYYKILDKSCN